MYTKISKVEGYTREQQISCMKVMIRTNKTFALYSFNKLIENQTEYELMKYRSIEDNYVGFDMVDAPIATKIHKDGTEIKNINWIQSHCSKYATQLIAGANQERWKKTLDKFYMKNVCD